MLAASARAVQDRIIASDPGLVRLLLAGRGTLSVFLAGLAAVLAAPLLHRPVVAFAAGVTLSMMAPFLMSESRPAQRVRTLFVLLLPAAAATAGTTLLHEYGRIGDAGFLALVFLGFLFHARGPRMLGIGLVAMVMTYIGLFLHLPPAMLPAQLLSLVGALPIIAFACFVALPMRPARTLRRAVAAVQWRAARVLHDANRPGGDSAERSAAGVLARDLARLNEAVLAADDQLALLRSDRSNAVRRSLLDVELATARLIEAMRTADPADGSAAQRDRTDTRLRLHERRIRRGRRYVVPVSRLAPGSLLAQLVALGHAVHGLGLAARATVSDRPAQPAGAPPAALPAALPGPLAWRLAFRVALAAALAMAGGMALSPQRWFWAVITVYVVFLNARSRGHTIYKGLQRLGGTLLGMVSGLVVATLLAGDPVAEIAVLLLSIFGMYYFIMVSYTIGIFCITVMLGLLYGMLGAPLESILLLRLEETAIGAAAAFLVAAFVLPTPTRDQVMRSGRNVLAALAASVRASRRMLAGRADALPADTVRQVDRQVADLRLALAPLTARRMLWRRSALERPVPALLDCVQWARVLAVASRAPAPHAQRDGFVARARAIEARLCTLAGARSDADGAEAALPAPSSSEPAADSGEVASALEQLDAAVAILAERLKLGAMEGFALDA